jgi:hypothetical protein
MGLLDDLAREFETYPRNYLTIEIVEVDPPGSNPDINEDEEVSFRIQVTNRGPLDANQVSLLVEGRNGTEVKSNGAAAPWGPAFTLPGDYFGDVLGHSHDDSGPKLSPGGKFFFRNSQDFSTPTELLRVSVAGWTTDLNHLSAGHTPADRQARAVFSSTVLE